MNVLLVCSLFSLPYRVLQCIAATGATVHILGGIGARGLRYSRYCRSFVLYEGSITGERDRALADEINNCTRKFRIDMVVPAGPSPTRAIVANRDMVDVPCFPLPSLKKFDTLNNKWHFTKLCMEHGIACPPSVLFADRAQVLESLQKGSLALPAIAKPLSEDGGHGVLRLDDSNALSQIEQINYRPIIVQDFIEGDDIGASVYCERGEIRSFIANSFSKGIYTTFHDSTIFDAFSRIIGPLEVDGVYHFDMRLTPDKRIFYLECNPRFYFKIGLSMMAGINFVHCGLDKEAAVPFSIEPGTQVKRPWAVAASLGRPWAITKRDMAQLWSPLSDPIPFMRESLRIDWDS
jgi:predicted ATP-grasp superfamily ATP-dependent carboligase